MENVNIDDASEWESLGQLPLLIAKPYAPDLIPQIKRLVFELKPKLRQRYLSKCLIDCFVKFQVFKTLILVAQISF
jgi:hypothetical protein